jgi:hypothetical protein
MADTPSPTPLTAEAAGELQQIETQLNMLRAAGDAKKDFEFRALGGVDAILALTAKRLALLGDPAELTATEETGPKLSSDPAEAVIGLTEATPRDPQAVETRLAHYMDTSTWTPEVRALARGFSAAIPPVTDTPSRECFDAAITLIRDAGSMESDAGKWRYSEEHCDELTAAQWGNKYDTKWDFIEAVLGQLQPREVNYLRGRHLLTYPPFLDKLATVGERFLHTDDGIRWRLAQSRQALKSKDE